MNTTKKIKKILTKLNWVNYIYVSIIRAYWLFFKLILFIKSILFSSKNISFDKIIL